MISFCIGISLFITAIVALGHGEQKQFRILFFSGIAMCFISDVRVGVAVLFILSPIFLIWLLLWLVGGMCTQRNAEDLFRSIGIDLTGKEPAEEIIIIVEREKPEK
jgi:thiosulfate reductase cytochrome b subunit